ncbi:MAG: calcium/sodium antiporter [Alphaproteobacteria bacterium]|nr:calcium/sodium antiporter [Alphaproteobacteria bacterium]
MLTGTALLLAGLILAGVGGELFVRGLVGIARWARIAPGIVALTLAAFATSSPELSVSVNAALEGRPQIGLGDAIGSNVVNVALIFAIALLMQRHEAGLGNVRRDFPVALVIPVLTAFLILDGELSRLDGLLMLALFAAWLGFTIVEGWRRRSAAEEVLAEPHRWLVVPSCVVGFALLIAAGHLVVLGGMAVGQALGLSLFAIGATVVALGTSIPELATIIIARMRGHGEVGLGTILGSNIFNGLFIVSVAAIIQPIAVRWQDVAVGLGFGALAIAVIYPPRHGGIDRRRGAILLAIYVAFVVALLQSPPFR